ncbi:MAG: VCBS domain-containing protein, partial [Methylococcaceae bacterium]
TVTVTDDQTAKVEQDVTVTVTGSNDVPTVIPDKTTPTASYTELDKTTASTTEVLLKGDISYKDVDLNDTHTATQKVKSLTWSGGTLTAAQQNTLTQALSLDTATDSKGTGSGKQPWSFKTPDQTFDFLAVGETLVAVYTVTIADALAAKTEQDVTLTLTGTNDLPTITVGSGNSAAASLTEANGSLDTSGTLSVTDLDITNTVSPSVDKVVASGITVGLERSNSDLLAMMTVDTTPIISATATQGTLNWKFGSGAESFDYLARDEVLTLTYTLKVTDSSQGTATQDVVLTVKGTNDAPLITFYQNTASLTETNTTLTATGFFVVRDVDYSDIINASNLGVTTAGVTAGLVPSLNTLRSMLAVGPSPVIDSTSTVGSLNWSFNSSSEAFDYLALGESLTLTYSVFAIDPNSATADRPVVITINGTNDAPTIRSTATHHVISGSFTETASTTASTTPRVIYSDNSSTTTVEGIAFADKDFSDTHTVARSLNSLKWAWGNT